MYSQCTLNLPQCIAACFNSRLKAFYQSNFRLKHCNNQEYPFPLGKQYCCDILSQLPGLFVTFQAFSCTQGSEEAHIPKEKQSSHVLSKQSPSFSLIFPFLSFSCVQYRATETAPRMMLVDVTWTSAPNTRLGSTALPLGAILPALVQCSLGEVTRSLPPRSHSPRGEERCR